jgi:hypothetical protein
MRIILWLAAAAGAAAIATAAPARPGGGGSGHGHGPGLQVGWSNGGGYHGAKRGHTRFGIGRTENGHRHGRFGRSGRDDFNPYGGIGIAGPIGEVDPHGTGFFAAGGGQIRLRGGRPYFEYDRAYPYEFASVAGGRRQGVVEEERASEPRQRCTMENGVRVCRGW